ncbi:class I SAM-dependent methyltransferase [Streptacidiphilus sp. P02-A3a]|uniref:class I SAM-dependent methyltransferase n=1 Tax=Streptacidiphilus sp. P02-A3a TaxID=2704468 RepID=UPI0015F7FD83|nr:class I SAM-dependent methyltransferase [Streptacidiphilus sp. P02-A3a]QMU71813.1 class I SAM-dependent methyltransferase [Streptacidiphilus sp. P02-A3a]
METFRSSAAYAKYYMDPELNHSSGYFQDIHASLADAQRSKVEAVLQHCRIQPSMRLLDIGCGWGAAARSASRTYGGSVTGITLDSEHVEYAQGLEEDQPLDSRIDYRVQDWGDFHEPVDRIISINSFENFKDKESFFPHCRAILPVGGVMVVLTVTADRPMFRVIPKRKIISAAERAGFDVEVSDSLAHHYVRTLENFIHNITEHKDEVVALMGADRVEKDLAFYAACADLFRRELNDMFEFTFVAR